VNRIGRVARKVDLADRLSGQGVDIGLGREAQIARADEHVVDIDQQAASGPGHQAMKEFDLAHLVTGQGDIERWVFDQDPSSQRNLCDADIPDHQA
jgi:hypothetical protein